MATPRDELVEKLKEALLAGPPLRLAMLFGSTAKGVDRADSDVDVGIVPADEDLSAADETHLAASLSRATRRDVDLVRLDRASTLLRWQVAKNHVPLLANPAYELPRFLARAGIEHADLRIKRDPAQRLYLRRLAERADGTKT